MRAHPLRQAEVLEHLVIMALYQAAMVDEHFAERLRLLLEPNLHDVADHLEHIRAAGGQLPGDPLVVASAVVVMMSQFAFTWLLGSTPLNHELSEREAVDTLTRFIVHGISGPAAGPTT